MADVGQLYSSNRILMVVPMFLMHPLGFQHVVQNTFLCKRDSYVLNSTTKERVNPIFRIINKSSCKMRNGSGVTFYLTPPAAALGCGDFTEAPQPSLFSSLSSLAVHDTSGWLLCPHRALLSSTQRREGHH